MVGNDEESLKYVFNNLSIFMSHEQFHATQVGINLIRAKELRGKYTRDAEKRGMERKYADKLAARMKKPH